MSERPNRELIPGSPGFSVRSLSESAVEVCVCSYCCVTWTEPGGCVHQMSSHLTTPSLLFLPSLLRKWCFQLFFIRTSLYSSPCLPFSVAFLLFCSSSHCIVCFLYLNEGALPVDLQRWNRFPMFFDAKFHKNLSKAVHSSPGCLSVRTDGRSMMMRDSRGGKTLTTSKQ